MYINWQRDPFFSIYVKNNEAGWKKYENKEGNLFSFSHNNSLLLAQRREME